MSRAASTVERSLRVPAGTVSANSAVTPAGMRGGTIIRSAGTKKQFTALCAPAAGGAFKPMGTRRGSIAPIDAISPDGTKVVMKKLKPEYRLRLEQYLSSMMQFKIMRSKGILTDADYGKIEAVIARKYRLENRNIYRGVDLLCDEFRGMMSHYKGVT